LGFKTRIELIDFAAGLLNNTLYVLGFLKYVFQQLAAFRHKNVKNWKELQC